jgi:CheY-like chemotaxis protein
VISVDDSWQRGIRLGAFAFLKKPVSKRALDEAFTSLKGFLERKVKELLIVEDNEIERENLTSAIGNSDVHTTSVGTAAEALERLRTQHFDCLVLDLNLPDMSGLDLLEAVKRDINLPYLRVVVYTGRDLTQEERLRLEEMAETTIVKDVRSLEHLLDKTALFLHRIEAKHRAPLGHMPAESHGGMVFAGKKVLLVDDDARNVFALTSKLERWEIVALRAENGKLALEILQNTPGIDMVLMDIMMPEMDGYETIRAIRSIERFRHLPIIALTAKAMKDDRRKCLESGASDYLAKPVGSEQFESMLRVWLQRRAGSIHSTGEPGRSSTQ